MSFIDRIIPRKQKDGSWFYSLGGAKYDAWKDIDNLKDFSEIPELNAVINWKASAFRNAKFRIEDANGKIIKDDVDIFTKPNYFQAQGEFLRQTKLFHEIHGDEYLYILSGLKNTELNNIRGIFTLPPHLVSMSVNVKKPFWLERKMPELTYYVKWGNNKKIPISAKDIIHLNDNRVNIDSSKQSIEEGQLFKGESKIQALKPALNNIRAAYLARGTNLEESGPRGILSNSASDGAGGTIPLDPKELEKIHEEMQLYGTQKGQRRQIITNMALSWQAMGFSTVHLKAFEEVTEDHHKICDSFGLKIDLFSREKGSTYNNKEQAEVEAYQDTIIPEMNEWVDAWNLFLDLPSGQKIVADFSHLPIFAEDVEQKATTMVKLTTALDKMLEAKVITIQEYRDVMENYIKKS